MTGHSVASEFHRLAQDLEGMIPDFGNINPAEVCNKNTASQVIIKVDPNVTFSFVLLKIHYVPNRTPVCIYHLFKYESTDAL